MKKHIRDIFGVKPKQMFGYNIYPYNFLRKLPDFIIIGSQKAASSSLHHYLSLHTNILTPPIKETQFFNMNYDRELNYYKSIFPVHKRDKLVFESISDYLSHPLAPKLCHKFLPNIKIIVTLREPVSRAFSHFNFVKNYEGEPLDMSFEEAISLEEKRIESALNSIESNRYYSAAALSRYGYKRNGEYAKHIKNWLKYYPINQFKFVDFNNIKTDLNIVMTELSEFLNIPYEGVVIKKIQNKSRYNIKLNPNTKEKLTSYYSRQNKELFSIIGQNLYWD